MCALINQQFLPGEYPFKWTGIDILEQDCSQSQSSLTYTLILLMQGTGNQARAIIKITVARDNSSSHNTQFNHLGYNQVNIDMGNFTIRSFPFEIQQAPPNITINICEIQPDLNDQYPQYSYAAVIAGNNQGISIHPQHQLFAQIQFQREGNGVRVRLNQQYQPYVMANEEYWPGGFPLSNQDTIKLGRVCLHVTLQQHPQPRFILRREDTPQQDDFGPVNKEGILLGYYNGNNGDNYRVLNDEMISTNHAVVRYLNNRFLISDHHKKSRFGTLIRYNEQMILNVARTKPLGLQFKNKILKIELV